MLPGIRSTDYSYISYLRLLSNELDSKLKFSPTDEGMAGENGVTGSFAKLRTLSGVPMTPLTYLPASNERLVSGMGLPGGFIKESHRQIFEELADLMWGKATPTNFRVPKNSSSGFPFMTKDDGEKLEIFRYVMKHIDSILDLVRKGDLDSLAREHGFVIAYFMNTRGQADTPGKVREVNDFEYAKTGGAKGKRFPASKQVVIDGNVIEDFSAMRMRTVCGMSMAANVIINLVQYPVRKSYQHNFSFTWHHTTYAEKLRKVQKYKYLLDMDVTAFDQSVQQWMIDAWLSRIEKYLDPRLVELLRLAHRAPYFQPSVDGKQPGRWLGNPLDVKEFVLSAGLMSGIATVSDLGKFLMVWAYLCWIDDETHDVRAFGIARILKGEHPDYAMLNMGDDCRILLNSMSLRARLLASAKAGKGTYFRFDIEEGGSFIGDVAIRKETIDIVPNIMSYFEKFLVAERGIDSKFRRFWPYGYYERKTLFSRAPAYQEAESIDQWAWKKAFPEYSSKSVIVDKFMRDFMLELPSARSVMDLQVLMDSNKLHYAVDPDEVSQSVLDELVMSIPFEDTAHIFRKLYQGELEAA